MSSVAEGWYLDPSTGTNLRFWSGSTWTDEVAPLPPDSPQLGLFAAEPEPEPAAEPSPAPEPAPEPEPAAADVPLEAELEHTQLTRRELRARRGTDPELNDAPRHLPLIAPPPVVEEPAAEQPEDVELEIPPAEAAPPPAATPTEEVKDPTRRHRILRMTVLLGILTVVSSVGVLTAGSL